MVEEQKKPSLDEIITAVSQKENVLRPIKKTPEKNTTLNLKNSFLSGIFFGLGFVLVIGLAALAFTTLHSIHTINTMFYKFVYVLRVLGK